MIQSAGCSDWHSLNSIFVERSDCLKKETLNLESVKPLLLHSFAWINLPMVITYALYDNLVPDVWKVNEGITQSNQEAKIDNLQRRI